MWDLDKIIKFIKLLFVLCLGMIVDNSYLIIRTRPQVCIGKIKAGIISPFNENQGKRLLSTTNFPKLENKFILRQL